MNKTLNKTWQVALDGPAGSGKSTVGKLVAKRLNYVFIDTGAMYRALALKAQRTGVSTKDEAGLTAIAKNSDVVLDNANQVFLDGENITALIRTPEISKATSEISAFGPVRVCMVQLQRNLALSHNVVMDGRDVGTVILPKAFLKIFLTASVEERVRRRIAEQASRGINMSEAQVREEVVERDLRDTTRKESPLRKAADAIEISTDGLSIEDIVDKIVALAHKRAK